MDLENIYTQIEAELAWRQEEIRFFQNLYNKTTLDSDLDQCRRSLVLLLYAHFEGFCKFSLTLYVNTINQEHITCNQATSAIVTASFSKVFHDLNNPESKASEFKRSLPEDKFLHKYARQREFIERTDEFKEHKVIIPDNYIDTESNLKPVVLRKLLFKLGFEHDKLSAIESNISKLLGIRNDIAHGSSRDGIQKKQYEELRDDTYTAIDHVKRTVTEAIRNKSYMKSSVSII